jgi:hypothetical protein
MTERIKAVKGLTTLKAVRTYIKFFFSPSLCFRPRTLPVGVRRLGDCCLKFTKNSIGPIYLHFFLLLKEGTLTESKGPIIYHYRN